MKKIIELAKRNRTILLVLVIILSSLLAFYKSFELSIYGDSWNSLAYYKYGNGFLRSGSMHPNHFQHFFTPYGPFDITMGLISELFGYNAEPYFIIAWLLRLIAAFSLYPITWFLTRNKTAVFFTIAFFSLSSIGLQATDWVFNMPVYLAIVFVNFFLFFYLSSREPGHQKRILFAALFFYSAYVFAPVRMTGLLPFVVFLEFIFLLQKRSIDQLKSSAARLLVFIVAFILIGLSGHSIARGVIWTSFFSQGATTGYQLLSKGRYDFLFNPVINLGGMVYPTFIFTDYSATIATQKVVFLLTISFLLYMCIAGVLSYCVKPLKHYFPKIFSVLGILLLSLIFITHLRQQNTFSNLTDILSLVIGGCTFIFIGTLVIAYRKKENVVLALIVPIAWAMFAFLPAWWWVNDTQLQTYHRYLAPCALGVALLIGSIISLGTSQKEKLLLGCLFILLLFIPHAIADHVYFTAQIKEHGDSVNKKIWSQMPHFSEIGKGKQKQVFYFEAADDGVMVTDAIVFGFPAHMALLYDLKPGQLDPTATAAWSEIVSAVTDGVYLQTPGKPLPIKYIYGFRLEKEKLTNITESIRGKLRSERKKIKT